MGVLATETDTQHTYTVVIVFIAVATTLALCPTSPTPIKFLTYCGGCKHGAPQQVTTSHNYHCPKLPCQVSQSEVPESVHQLFRNLICIPY